ncbi:hypothetical protein V7167_17335 [Bacillus toyonensis]|uniref:hypothetical protein n=1 Tax=Bacillus toyonensis TaxID=155322 RepID=UPI002FFF2169
MQGRYCYTRIATIEVIDNKVERDNLVERVEVLEKVKNLLLLPELEMATTQQVADFYGVGLEAIKAVVHGNKSELELDGYKTLSGKEIKGKLDGCQTQLSRIEPRLGHFVVIYKGEETKIAYRNVALFPKRAILRVGMLLRDSEVAKEVRTQLLNIEENTAAEVKTYEIDYEVKFLGEVLKFTELWRNLCS